VISLPLPLPDPSIPLPLSPSLSPSLSLPLSQGRPRPPSTVEKLLQAHGLQHFSERLISNGYDDIHFVTDISDEELQEIGITQLSDRSKVRLAQLITSRSLVCEVITGALETSWIQG